MCGPGVPGHPPKGVVPRYPPRGVLRDCSRTVPGSCRGVVSPLSGSFPHSRVKARTLTEEMSSHVTCEAVVVPGLPKAPFTPWGRTCRDFPHLSWGWHRRGDILAWCRPGGSAFSTGLGPSSLFGKLLLVTTATDVTLPLGILHQEVHRHMSGVVFAHICANLPTEPLHIAALHLALRVYIPTEAT